MIYIIHYCRSWFSFFKFSPENMFIDFREREKRERGKGGGEGQRERNIDWLPSVYTLTWGQTHNLGMRPVRARNLLILVYGATWLGLSFQF